MPESPSFPMKSCRPACGKNPELFCTTPYKKPETALAVSGFCLCQNQLKVTTSWAGALAGSTDRAVSTGPVASGVWPL